MPSDHIDTHRGYDLYRVRTVVDADQGETTITRHEATTPHNHQIATRATTLSGLKQKVAALPQAYVEVGDYIFQLTHDRAEPRDIVVNVFTRDGNVSNGPGVENLPWAASADQIRAAIKNRYEATPEEIMELVQICRTPPVEPPGDRGD